MKLYWFLKECWIIYGFRGVLIGLRHKFLYTLDRVFHLESKSWDFYGF